MRRIVRGRGWLWVVGIGLGLCVVISVCVVLLMHHRGGSNPAVVESGEPSTVVSGTAPSAGPVISIEAKPELPDFFVLAGSVEDACGLYEFPPYWKADGMSNDLPATTLDSEECRTALEVHVDGINPYLWDRTIGPNPSPFVLVVLDEPLSFERVFADPTGDMIRMQDAMSRPECLLKGDERNWELKETCHADAFLNYALINHFCFDQHARRRSWPAFIGPDDDPTPEQNRLMWKQALEDAWMKEKCLALDSTLDFTELYPGLYESMNPPRDTEMYSDWRDKTEVLLVELSARLGDDAAGLTQRHGLNPPGGGYKFGRFTELIDSEEWRSLILTGATRRVYTPQSKREPNTKQFLSIFSMLAQADSPKASPLDKFQFNWQAVVKHLCAPTYLRLADAEAMGVEPNEIQSCKEIVSEIRDIDINSPPVLAVMGKFERIALELEVYE